LKHRVCSLREIAFHPGYGRLVLERVLKGWGNKRASFGISFLSETE